MFYTDILYVGEIYGFHAPLLLTITLNKGRHE